MTLLHHFLFSRQKPFVKNIVNGIFWIFILFSAYLLLLAQESFWEYPRFQGIISFLSALCIALPLLVYRSTRLRALYHKRFVYISEMLVAVPLGLNGLGAVFFFDAAWGFDSFMHFLNSLLAALLIFLVLGALWKHDTMATRIILYFFAVAGAFVAGALMEAWEYFSDFFFQTHTWGEMGQDPRYDTMVDLFYDAIGVGLGALILFFRGRQWLFQLRRIPRVRAVTEAVQTMKERVHDHVREHVTEGKEKLRSLRQTLRQKNRMLQKNTAR